jgi:RNA polymerase sigma-70 factor (ECF subfamily)
MSIFPCPALYTCVQPGPLDPPADPVEPAAGEAPAPDDLVAAVGQVFAYGWVRALANRLGLGRDLDDANQTTFLRAWQARDHYNPNYPLIAWVARITRNTLIDMARSRGRRSTLSLFDDEGEQRIDPPTRLAGPLDNLIAREQEEQLEAILAQAPPLVREILTLKKEGLTFADIARRIGKKQAAVVSVYHRFKVATLERVLAG